MEEKAGAEAVVDLIQEVDAQLKNVHTQSLDISFNELADMVSTHELDISPDYQRLFQWSEGARSRFIESLLLEMPVPPIYVVEEENNQKLLIDGLQRLSSYLHFRGMLTAPHLRPAVNPGDKLILQDCDILPQLNGKTFDDLGTALQIKLKRSFVRVEVVRKGSNPKFKYHMFKRLNTGGESLTNQQLRNCTIRLLDPKFNDFVNSLAEHNADFRNCTATISEQDRHGAYDRELVLRYFAFKNWRARFKHDVADFLTEYMEAVADPDHAENFDYEAEKLVFERTFNILNVTLGEQAFSRANRTRTDLIAGFGIYQYEAFTLGIQPHLNVIEIDSHAGVSKVRDLFRAIKLNAEFAEITTGGGKNSPGLLNQRVGFVENRVAAAYA
ncbi:DUF262 domain-containing protein [Paraburkholderia terricola]|uniref:GmrSD restriction endonucleases N-terminal domain-containing protein n=1 Tax=Paraburkholderia terricola TaxID=169427 RepID=A0ABU1LVE6_9BURK|nr:DUF262 domain-containing protein [Paraburkholderia terricola]MDR6410738.1 hypothetical protein [Paraburkholderia terricola]MDR6484974.1 hypothetical protein [Paraburkholderia terricola]